MYEVNGEDGHVQRIPIDKIAIPYEDPDTGVQTPVPIAQLFIGGLDYATINAHAFVYDRKNGYISVRGEAEVGMRKLEAGEISLIEDVLKIKERVEEEAKNAEKSFSGADSGQKECPRLGK